MPPLGVGGLEAHIEHLQKQASIIQAVADAKKSTVLQEIAKYEGRVAALREENHTRRQARRTNK